MRDEYIALLRAWRRMQLLLKLYSKRNKIVSLVHRHLIDILLTTKELEK